MSSTLFERSRALLSPLMLAAYAAWAAVWITTIPDAAERDPLAGWAGGAAMLLFLLGMIVETVCQSLSERRFAGLALLMTGSSFVVLSLGPSGSAGILLVVLAAVLAGRWPPPRLAGALLLINTGMLLLMLWRWDASWRYALTMVAAFGSFQLFAALVMLNARRAEAMAATLREVNAELLATRSLLEQGARDAERLRLSRELHDVAGHGLTALKLNLSALARDARQPDPERIGLCAKLADDLLQNLRAVVRQMREQHGIDLHAAITRIVSPFPRPAVHLDIDPALSIERLDATEALLRTVQEGLTNAARHSGADNLWIVLQRDGDRLQLVMRDDGRGSQRLQPGNGLSGMRERLQAAGGGLEIRSDEGDGLQLWAWLPLEVAG